MTYPGQLWSDRTQANVSTRAPGNVETASEDIQSNDGINWIRIDGNLTLGGNTSLADVGGMAFFYNYGILARTISGAVGVTINSITSTLGVGQLIWVVLVAVDEYDIVVM